MEDKKKNDYAWVIRVVTITIGVCVAAIIVFFVILSGMDEYSRAQLEPKREQKALWTSAQTITVSTWSTTDVIQIIPRV
jgi:flagellar basal body-associated protein FliL